MDRGAWWARVHGATKSQTQLSTHTHEYSYPYLLITIYLHLNHTYSPLASFFWTVHVHVVSLRFIYLMKSHELPCNMKSHVTTQFT